MALSVVPSYTASNMTFHSPDRRTIYKKEYFFLGTTHAQSITNTDSIPTQQTELTSYVFNQTGMTTTDLTLTGTKIA